MAPILAFLSLFLFSFIRAEHDDDTTGHHLSDVLSNLWHMNTAFGSEVHVDGRTGQLRLRSDESSSSVDQSDQQRFSHSVLSAHRRLCSMLQGMKPNESKGRHSVDNAISALTDALSKRKLFKEAAHFYSTNNLTGSAENAFIEQVRALWLQPFSNPPYRALMCQFSNRPSSGSYMLAQHNTESDVLAEFSDTGEAEIHQKRHFPLENRLEFELSASSLCALLNQNKRCLFSLGNGKGQTELEVETEAYGHGKQQHISAFRFVPKAEQNFLLPADSSDVSFRIREELSDSAPFSLQSFRESTGGSGHHGHVRSSSPRRWENISKRNSSSDGMGDRSSDGSLSRSKSHPSLAMPVNIQQLVERLWDQDVDRVADVHVNWQEHMPSRRVVDVSDEPLINVTNDAFLQRPIYAALVDIYNQQLFHAPVCQDELPLDAQRRAKFEHFWELVTQSAVFRTAYDYLDRIGKTGHNFDAFTSELFDRWFSEYTRCKHCKGGVCRGHADPLGSSGWEHVFSGEWLGETVDGHHNWVRYYMQQKAGYIDYHGYYVKARKGDFIGTIQYKWKQYLKRIGGFLIGTSPAFDFSLFTVCALTESGNKGCKFNLFDTPLFVTSFLQGCTVNGSYKSKFCIATTFPGILHSPGNR